jgi:YegS/Rv2252/BmrU family lipid kinase
LPRRALLVANPGSGLGRTVRLAAAIARRLSARGLDVELALTPTCDAAARAAARAIAGGCDRVIVAGGDGTINSVLGALAHSPAALGVVPTGMANAFAREMGIPLAFDSACDVAADRHQRVLDLGRAGSRHFVLMAGIGFDADVVAHVSPRLKRLTGPGAYVAAGLARALRFRPTRVEVSFDHGRLTAAALLLVAANTAHYTYRWRIAPQARPDDGLLDVVIFHCRNALDAPAHVLGVLTGLHPRHPAVVTLRTRALRVRSERPLPLQIDGDAAGVAPVEMEIVPGALRVLAPPGRPVRPIRHAQGKQAQSLPRAERGGKAARGS